MKGCAIVCEYNPFHNGHKYQIEKIKSETNSPVVCVMSGNFTQRAEYAAFDKKFRANTALKNGADIVLELPFPFSCASAEIFAFSAVYIIENTGLCDSICFGAETPDAEKLDKLSDFLLSRDTTCEILKIQKDCKNLSFAKIRSSLIKQKMGEEFENIISKPNNILALEYLRAIKKLNSKIRPLPIGRVGAGHSAKPCGSFCSSSYLRENPTIGNFSKYTPSSGDVLKNAVAIDERLLFAAYSSFFIKAKPEDMRTCAEIQNGMEYRIKKASLESGTLADFYGYLSGKHLTSAKIRRAVLYSFFDIKTGALKEVPKSCMLLGCTDSGARLLKETKDKRAIPILSKYSDIEKYPFAKEQFYKNDIAEKVFQKFIAK